MPKRSRKEFGDTAEGAAVPIPKRGKSGEILLESHVKSPGEEGLALLLEHADDLIDCLSRLKPGSITGAPSATAAKEKLSALSSKLLPAFQALANSSEDTAVQAPEVRDPVPPLQIPAPASVTKWTDVDFNKPFPPLPQVLDPKLEQAALTHSGMNKPGGLSYERLEWVGDAYLEVIATALVYHTFPHLLEGRCAQIRELMVRNATLSTFTCKYGLDKRAIFPDDFSLGERASGTATGSSRRIKALGDIFEAYVGAVILSDPKDGVQRAADWVKALWAPVVQDRVQKEGRKDPAEKLPAKVELERALGAKGVKIEYRDLPAGKKRDQDSGLQLFSVGCFLHGWGETDKQLGYGSALSKREAGQKAAQMAFDNKKLLKPYIEKKKAYIAAKEAQQASETKV